MVTVKNPVVIVLLAWLFMAAFCPAPAWAAITLQDVQTVSKFVVGEVGGRLTKNITGPAMAMHNFLAQFGYLVTLEVQYEPMDVVLGIHLKDNPKESYKNRRIRLTARVSYNSAKAAAAGRMLSIATLNPMWFSAGQTLAAVGQGGVIGTINDFVAGFPKDGPQANKPIRWELPMSLLEKVQFSDNNWEGRFLTFTDSNGESIIYLYPVEDQFLGGVRTKEEFTVTARAVCQDVSITDIFQTGLRIGEEIIKPSNTQASAVITLEHHEPTRWQGSITVERAFTYQYSHSQKLAAEESGETLAEGSATWTYRLQVDNIKLNKEGFGEGDYTITVTATGIHDHTREETYCRFEPGNRRVVKTTDLRWQGQGTFSGRYSVRIAIRPDETPTYAVFLETLGLSTQIYGMGFKGEGGVETKGTTCSGTKLDDNVKLPSWPPPASQQFVIHLFAQSPQPYQVEEQWPAFDPDAGRLEGTLTWPTRWPVFSEGGSTVTGTTKLTWKLERIYD
ncbi:MAG TPA: hypothetical protein GXX29_09765 [Firmicutes bacterium]|nr:hypothetical protein [Bacillota bacterium]